MIQKANFHTSTALPLRARGSSREALLRVSFSVCPQGDSGGPLVCNGVAQGIVSYGDRRGSPPAVFTRIASFMPWVNRTMRRFKQQCQTSPSDEPPHALSDSALGRLQGGCQSLNKCPCLEWKERNSLVFIECPSEHKKHMPEQSLSCSRKMRFFPRTN